MELQLTHKTIRKAGEGKVPSGLRVPLRVPLKVPLRVPFEGSIKVPLRVPFRGSIKVPFKGSGLEFLGF